jgi:uncharacterized protein YlxW (UPF0749 family)
MEKKLTEEQESYRAFMANIKKELDKAQKDVEDLENQVRRFYEAVTKESE